MATKAQIEANRRNAQRSTGPRTDEAKARVRQNALRHGLCASIPQMSDENDEDVQQLLATLREEHEPVGAGEEILVYKMAEHLFYGKRASYLLSEQLDLTDQGENNSREVALMLRYHTTADRGFYRALNELRKLQKERRLEEIGFVSQNRELQPESVPDITPSGPPENPNNPSQPLAHPAYPLKTALPIENIGREKGLRGVEPFDRAA
jgi:hypothetical protein